MLRLLQRDPGDRAVARHGVEWGIALLCGASVLLFAILAVLRIGHPFELEWMEGGVLEHVRRIAAGEPLYVEPSLAFIPFPYPPLYYQVSALASAVVGEGFLGPRLVSLLASALTLALLYRLARRESGCPLGALVATGVFAASYSFSGSWFDVARVDSLSLALALGGLTIVRWRSGAGWAALSGLLLFLAFLAKQSALGVAAALLVPIAYRSRREALAFGATLFGLVAVSSLYLNRVSDGWYGWYCYDLLVGHPLVEGAGERFFAAYLPRIGVAFLAAAVLDRLRSGRKPGPPFLFWAAAGFLASSWLASLHIGAYRNTLMPACAGAALVLGVAAGRAFRAGGIRAALAGGAVLVQLVLLTYDYRPAELVPSRADVLAGEELLGEIEALEGQVIVPYHPGLAHRAGKGASAHAQALFDVQRGADEAVAERLTRELEEALAARRWAAIVLDASWADALPAFSAAYRLDRRLFAADDARFVPVTGDRRRPELVFVPR